MQIRSDGCVGRRLLLLGSLRALLLDSQILAVQLCDGLQVVERFYLSSMCSDEIRFVLLELGKERPAAVLYLINCLLFI